MLSSSSGAAVSHYSDWSAINWAVGYLLLGIAAGVATFAVSMWIVAARDSAGGMSAWAFALGIVAGGIQVHALWALVRHIEQLGWAIALALLVVVVIATLTYQTVRADLTGQDATYYTPPVPARAWGIPTGVSAVLAIGVLVVDGIHRAAAALSMGVGLFILVVLSFGVWAILSATAPSSR
ncbi:hypothetical protein EV641_10699 [Rhodococcus sp. SMB37]|uniref:hypothetical protein n=1 Tax=Rhodococcus sp. SMB37 TaxID=2512213 RepID=UPI00104CB293|nr:hypothetical protein [Rhodococcus sp. SMB37]TCN53455.1 hypothetical protein EV641_10699 [Rhodococcus sp. SMB37]